MIKTQNSKQIWLIEILELKIIWNLLFVIWDFIRWVVSIRWP